MAEMARVPETVFVTLEEEERLLVTVGVWVALAVTEALEESEKELEAVEVPVPVPVLEAEGEGQGREVGEPVGDPDWVGEVVPQAVLDMVLDWEEVGVREAQVLGEEEGDMGVAAGAVAVPRAASPEGVPVVEKELEAEAVLEWVPDCELLGEGVEVG